MMNRLEPGVVERFLAGEPVSHRSTSLRHAALHRRPGLRGDDPSDPSSVVWLRPGDPGAWEAFAAGEPEPALGWLEGATRGSTVALLAPDRWEEAVRNRGGRVSKGSILTFLECDLLSLPRFSAEAVPLTMGDQEAFEAIAPAWALRSWGDFGAMIGSGLALGLRSAVSFVAMAWVYESDPTHDKLGVATLPNYRRLGLGRRVAGALLERVVRDRRKVPLWVTAAENLASSELARSLGFSNPTTETLLRWTHDRG